MDFTVVHTPGKDKGMLTFTCTLLNATIFSDDFLEKRLAFDTVFQKIFFPIRWKKIMILWLFIFPHIELYDFNDRVYRENGAASSLPLLAWKGSFQFSYSPLYFHCWFRQGSVVQELKTFFHPIVLYWFYWDLNTLKALGFSFSGEIILVLAILSGI